MVMGNHKGTLIERPGGFLTLGTFRCRANMAHIRQSRPDSGRGFQVKVLKTVEVFPTQQRAVLPPGAMPPTPALSLSLSHSHTLCLSLMHWGVRTRDQDGGGGHDVGFVMRLVHRRNFIPCPMLHRKTSSMKSTTHCVDFCKNMCGHLGICVVNLVARNISI